MAIPTINIIGAGLAGTEASYQLARLGLRLIYMKVKD